MNLTKNKHLTCQPLTVRVLIKVNNRGLCMLILTDQLFVFLLLCATMTMTKIENIFALLGWFESKLSQP